MTPQDVVIFQILAGLFTLSFTALCFFIFRFMRGLEQSCNELISVATRLEKNWSPILVDLRGAAAELRTAGELAHEGARKFSDLGERARRLGSRTEIGVKGVWSMLAQAAGAFFNAR